MVVREAININHCEAEIYNDKYITNIISSFLYSLKWLPLTANLYFVFTWTLLE